MFHFPCFENSESTQPPEPQAAHLPVNVFYVMHVVISWILWFFVGVQRSGWKFQLPPDTKLQMNYTQTTFFATYLWIGRPKWKKKTKQNKNNMKPLNHFLKKHGIVKSEGLIWSPLQSCVCVSSKYIPLPRLRGYSPNLACMLERNALYLVKILDLLYKQDEHNARKRNAGRNVPTCMHNRPCEQRPFHSGFQTDMDMLGLTLGDTFNGALDKYNIYLFYI